MMPAIGFVRIRGRRRLPPLPLPLILLWPLVPLGSGVAWLLGPSRPAEAAKLRLALRMFRELRGLAIDIDSAEHDRVRVRFI